MKSRRFDNRESLNVALTRRLKEAAEAGGGLMLSGGHAPRPAYAALGMQSLRAGPTLRLMYSDERYVPATSEASNYRASLPLVQGLKIAEEDVLRVRTELAVEEAAADYEQRLLELSASGITIHFGLLGMGADGHTASLFRSADLEHPDRLAVPTQRPDGMQAITVTPGLLARVERLLMVVIGREKREALAAFIARDPESIAWRAVRDCADIELWSETNDV